MRTELNQEVPAGAGAASEATGRDSALLSLSLVLTLMGEPADLGQLRAEFLAPGALAGPDDLIRILKSLEYRARWVRSSPARIDALTLPVIGRRPDGEFFLIGRRTASGVLVGLAGGGPTEWTLEELARRWDGRALLITRRKSLGGGRLDFGLGWFWPAVRRHKRPLLQVLLVSAVIQLLALVSPMIFQVAIDKVFVHRGLSTLELLVIGLVAIHVADAVLGFLRTYVFAHTTSRMDALLGAQLFEHLISLPIAFFETRPTGETVARMRELETVRQFITSSALTLVIDLVFSVVCIGVMLFYSVKLTVVVLVAIPLYALLSLAVSPALQAQVKDKFQRNAANQSVLVESLSGIQTLKAMAVEPQMRRRWDDQLAGYVASSLRVVSLGAAGSQAVELVSKLMMAALLWFGAQMVIDGSLTIGAFVAFNMLAGQITTPVLRLAHLWQDFQQFRLAIARLADIMNLPGERFALGSRQTPPPIRGDIRFDQVTFRYRAGAAPVLSGLSLHITQGQVVGIVGRSGSGKSTLTKLLQRLYVPEDGRILVDGLDIALLDPAGLRRQIGVVLQENVLFHRTIRENIALADPSMPLGAVMRAAELAGAAEFIADLPQGYGTVLEERGSNLSGGQRQRIAIARALIGDPRILIFDEATSALDYESERAIQANMKAICEGRTVLIVAHRLSTVRDADRILVMDKGRLVEDGSHDALMALDGHYAALVRQAGR